jgi:hypothetical protein
MTNETENKTEKKKGAKPTHEIFPVGADGKPNYKARVGYWQHGKGGGGNFSIGNQRYVLFPVRAQVQPAAEGVGA